MILIWFEYDQGMSLVITESFLITSESNQTQLLNYIKITATKSYQNHLKSYHNHKTELYQGHYLFLNIALQGQGHAWQDQG